ncbi:hypothetical protein [Acetobacter oeni]|uniref:hypothetical protein n=1 Tax=Acetobacter oeni TaxID=304077 RepID=UPI0011BF831C|nr:hypothetical protein [Acetobacter oeni]MBB3882441.1 hypothetical protein [Acetobacter oeni]NHO18465.1 hypothetical protein [Acetobacter oeni]
MFRCRFGDAGPVVQAIRIVEREVPGESGRGDAFFLAGVGSAGVEEADRGGAWCREEAASGVMGVVRVEVMWRGRGDVEAGFPVRVRGLCRRGVRI